MKQPVLLYLLLLTLSPVLRSESPIPSLAQRGAATQLIVDGTPYLIRGGEVANTASSSLTYMDEVWPKMTRLNLNTVLVAVAWAWVEPIEGKFDFLLVDGLLEGARKNDQRVVFLWFGSWKNGLSSFAPAWVKADQQRFPRVQIASGKSVEILTPLSASALAADTKAYVAFMSHLREVDPQRTVIMLQMQNEVGVIGDSRDRSAAANAAFAAPVPDELMAHLARNKARLSTALSKLWNAAGAKSAGTWSQVFGESAATDELFMAWHYAHYMGQMTAAGKAAYPLPVFTNTWIVQPEDRGPGDYPSGGPQPLSLDVWKAGAPAIDLNCPDIYLPNFDEQVASFHRTDNPLFVPESRGDAAGVANAFYAIGAHAALGYSPFGIDNTARLLTLRPAPGTPAPAELEGLPLARGYAVLRDLTPLILEHQGKGSIGAAWLNKAKPRQEIALGDYTLSVELRRSSRDQSFLAELGYGLVLALAPDEFLVAGSDIQVTFTPRTPGAPIAGIADAEAGTAQDGRWIPGRKLSGDDILLNYHLAQQADINQSGSGLRFGPDGPTLQRVKLYRYR
jgi:Domain of unknown function (DUF5597)/Beta-galactosidase